MLRSCRWVLRQAELQKGSKQSLRQFVQSRASGKAMSLSAQRVQQASTSEKLVEFLNSDNNRVQGTFVDGGQSRVVILCHGFASNSEKCYYPEISERLQDLGVGTLRFDFAGNKRSEGKFYFGKFDREVEDLRGAVLKMRELGQQVVGVVGHSKAGTVVLMYGAKYGDIPLIVNIAGRFDMRLGMQLKFGPKIVEEVEANGSKQLSWPDLDGELIDFVLTKECVGEVLGVDNVAIAGAIKGCRVLTIHGTRDVVTPVADGHSLHKYLPEGSELLLVNDADHCFTQHGTELVDAIVGFVSSRQSS